MFGKKNDNEQKMATNGPSTIGRPGLGSPQPELPPEVADFFGNILGLNGQPPEKENKKK